MLQQMQIPRRSHIDDDPFSGVAEEEEQEEDLLMDERNDIYTAKGSALQVPVTAGTKSQSSIRGGGRIDGNQDGQNTRP